MTMVKALRMPPAIITGEGSVEAVGRESARLGLSKALLVTDRVMVELGFAARVSALLRDEGLQSAVFDGVAAEPTVEYVEEGLKLYGTEKCDFLVGLGGGSPLDTAKAISVMATNEGSIRDYQGLHRIPRAGAPLVAVPTTAGTGSEVTMFTIITDKARGLKMLIGGLPLMPAVAIADPLLTHSMPPSLTAATGVDSLCHAIEAYVSLKAHHLSDVYALSAIELLSANLRQSWANGSNNRARAETMLGALMAGIAFSNSSVTLVHGMSRPIGARFGVPHGLSNAVLLPVVMDFSVLGDPARFARVAAAMGVSTAGQGHLDAARLGVDAVRRLVRDIQVPTMRELGISEESFEAQLEEMADAAIASGSPANNPRQAGREEIIALYKLAYASG